MASNNKISKVELKWHYNIFGHFFVLLFIFIVFCLTVIIKDSLFEKEIIRIEDKWFEYSKKFGLSLDDVVIEGRNNLQKEEILALLNVGRGTSFLAINEKEVENKIKQLAWVKDVYVKKSYIPNVLQISLVEKKVIALYQKEGKFYPLDEGGEIIKANFFPKEEYLIVLGEGAPENIKEIFEMISENEPIFKRIKALQHISSRRWDVILDDLENGKKIKLGEDNFKQGWKKLIKLNITHGILKRPLTIIDLRFDNKIIFEIDNKSKKQKIREKKT